MDRLISERAVLGVINEAIRTGRFYYGKNQTIKEIKDIPSAEPKTGHWKKKEDDTCWWYVCSECEQEPLKNRWNDDDVLSTFCPNCGAKMQEVDNGDK